MKEQRPKPTIKQPERLTEGYFKSIVREYYSQLTPDEIFELWTPDERDTEH